MHVLAWVVGRQLLYCSTLLVIYSLIPLAVGWSSALVMSGSMAPKIAAGDVVVYSDVDPEQIIPGMVLVVEDPAAPGKLLTHRVVRQLENGQLVLRGDANEYNDSTPVPVDNVRGAGRVQVKWVGLPRLWVSSGQWLHMTVLAIVFLAALLLPEPAVLRTADKPRWCRKAWRRAAGLLHIRV